MKYKCSQINLLIWKFKSNDVASLLVPSKVKLKNVFISSSISVRLCLYTYQHAKL